jgi:conjugal transfer/entry exclusion protein
MQLKTNLFLKELEHIKEENKKLKDRFDFYNSKLANITKEPLMPDSNMVNINKAFKTEYSNSSNQKFSQFDVSPKKPSKFIIKNIDELVFQKALLDNKVQKLSEENEKLKTEKKKSEISTETDYVRKEYNEQKKRVQKLEKTHETYQKQLEDYKNLLDNTQRIETPEFNEIQAEEKYKNLQKYLKKLEKSRKASEFKFKQKLKDLEKLDTEVTQTSLVLKMKLLKAKQQERLLESSILQVSEAGLSGSKYSNVDFLYKPSIKNLYY